MHPLHPEDVGEEMQLQGADFPTEADDQRPHYEYMKTMLKALQWLRGPKRWS